MASAEGTRISVRLAPDLAAEFSAVARVRGVTRSEAARAALAAYCEATITSLNDDDAAVNGRGVVNTSEVTRSGGTG
jgi:metal-responsive CopG/Arc/MetJ family transcriptional regulator